MPFSGRPPRVSSVLCSNVQITRGVVFTGRISTLSSVHSCLVYFLDHGHISEYLCLSPGKSSTLTPFLPTIVDHTSLLACSRVFEVAALGRCWKEWLCDACPCIPLPLPLTRRTEMDHSSQHVLCATLVKVDLSF